MGSVLGEGKHGQQKRFQRGVEGARGAELKLEG